MRDINDDMDDLFRRAADGYPLNTNSSDWNKVHNALQSSENANMQDAKGKKRYRRFLWLLLLLPFAFVVDKYVFQNGDNGNSITKHQPASTEQKNISPKKIDKENFNRKEETEPASITKEGVLFGAKEGFSAPAKEDLSSPGRIIQNKNSDETLNRIDGGRVNRNVQNKYFPKQKVVASEDIITEDLNKEADKNFTAIEDKNKNPAAIKEDFEATENKGIEAPKKEINTTNMKETGADTSDKADIKANENKNVVANDTLKADDIIKAPKSIPLKKSRPHYFYVGIVAGPDLSTVKLEKIIKTGFTLGVITGYRFNKKLSIESGLLLDKKYYYSEGKYFNTKNMNLPYYVKIDNVDGDCHMIELPLNVKYDFKSKKKVNWFAVAGISSYFMQKENYQYRYKSYGQPTERSISLKDATTIWASVMNFSLGYSHSMGKTGTFRIEPYVKIPFRGVGVGSLPITSSGIYLGFTKDLF